jgi:dihydrofolate reductase
LKLTIVAALASNGVIGRGGALPWHLPDDLRRFKALTLGRPVLMGRRTFESIGKPLPGRRNLVLTRGDALLPEGVDRVASIPAALALCSGAPEVCVIGGAEVYRQALPLATHLELTLVDTAAEGDVFFPQLEAAQWRERSRSTHPADERHAWPMSFLSLERV